MNLDLSSAMQWMLLAPLILGGSGIVLLVWRKKLPLWVDGLFAWLTSLVSLALLLLAILAMGVPTLEAVEFSWSLVFFRVDFHLDALSLYFVLLVNAIAFVASLSAISLLKDVRGTGVLQNPLFFHSSVNLFHFTMLLVPMVDNLIGLWVAIELTTLVSAFLVAYQNRTESWEAAWKYLIITSTGIILALLGTMFLANSLPEFSEIEMNELGNTIMNWSFLMDRAKNGELATDFVKLAFLFSLAGYGTKAGLAPLHTWLPDGHGESPAPISALLSGVLLKSALYAILRFYTLTNTSLNEVTFTSNILLAAGLFSLLLAAPFILKKNRFKRVLAYHSLEHMGIIVFGVGIGVPIALFGALLHTLNHAVTKSLMFLAYGSVSRHYETALGEKYDSKKITGVFHAAPWTGALLTLGGLALVGTPPFNIFLSEFLIVWGALATPLAQERAAAYSPPWVNQVVTPDFQSWTIPLAIGLFMLSTTLIYYGLVRHLAELVLHKMPGLTRLKEGWGLFPVIILFVFVVLLGVWIMPPLSRLIWESVQIVALQNPG